MGAKLLTLPWRGKDPLPEVGEEVGAVVVQNPNFLGALEDLGPFAEAAHGAGALFVAVADPLSLGVLKPPGAYGADIAVGDGQSLGLPMGFGGPHFGFLATKKAFVRQLPGRLVSETVDVEEGGASSSPSRPGSSTSGGPRPRATSPPTPSSPPSWGPCTSRPWGLRGLGRWP